MPYLNHLSEEAIFGSNKIKEQHEIMNLQNEEVVLRTLKSFINELNRLGAEGENRRNFSEKRYLYCS